MEKPSVGRLVHYVDKYDKHRAAVITAVDDRGQYAASIGVVILFVMVPNGAYTASDVPYSDLNEAGSWHWPERT